MAYVKILKLKKKALKGAIYKGLSRIYATFGHGVTCS